jgi:Magnesium chelatase, subunit ChlI C-terminal
MLDRIDIHVEVARVDYDKLSGSRLSEPSAAIRARVEAAHRIQQRRFASTCLTCNADMGPAEVRLFCELDEVSRSLLRSAGTRPASCAPAVRAARGIRPAAQDIAVPKVPAPLGAGTAAVPPRPDGVLRPMPSADFAEGEGPLPAAQQMQLSARTYHRLLKVGRTIAELARRTRRLQARPDGAPRRGDSVSANEGVASISLLRHHSAANNPSC